MDDASLTEGPGGQAQYVDLSFSDGALTVRPVGPALTQRESPIISDEVRVRMGELGETLRAVIIDLSEVATMTSMGLALCLDIRYQAQRQRARVALYGLSEEIAGLFRKMRLNRLYTIARTKGDLRRLAA